MARQAYASDVSDDEWAVVAPYVTLMKENAPQRAHSLREVLNGVRWMVRAGAAWRLLPHDLPPWYTVYQQTQRWLKAGVFDALVQDLRAVSRLAQGRTAEPSAAQGHVSFYFGDVGERVLLLGGNQNNQVNISSYPKAQVLSYRWPSEA